jgi:hypothetical protein
MVRVVIAFVCALMVSETAWAGNWNSPLESNGRIKEGTKPTLADMRNSYLTYYNSWRDWLRHSVEQAATPLPLEATTHRSKETAHALQNSGLISYLVFEDEKIVEDAISPPDRLGDLMRYDTKFVSASVGKSIVSYILGHAICEGYIDGIESNMNDWPIIVNTVYENQALKDLVNMNGGDEKYIKRRHARVNGKTIKFFDQSALVTLKSLKGTSASKSFGGKFYYSNFLPIVLNNYIAFKVGADYDKFMANIFQNVVRTEHEVAFLKMHPSKNPVGHLRYTFYASRYDYLRIAIAMLNDWRNDTCVGKYMKGLYANKIKKPSNRNSPFSVSKNYAGFFHTDFSGVNGIVFGMNGYGGQNIFINFDSGIILSAHAVHQDYNWRKLILDPVSSP